jgi:hypothetical protein
MRAARLAPWLALFAFGAALSVQTIRSCDYFFHLRTGQLIAETGRVPSADRYSYTVPGSPYVDVHWLHQLILYGVYSLGGHEAVVVWKLAMVTALVALLAAQVGSRRPALSVSALTLALVIAADRLMPRPELPTFVLLAATLLVFDRFERRGGAVVGLFVPIALVWVNLHGLYVLGFAVWGTHLGGELLRPLLRREPLRMSRLRLLALTGFGALAVCFVNPHGVAGVLYPFDQLLMIGTPDQRAAANLRSEEIASLVRNFHKLSPLLLAAFGSLVLLSGAALLANFRRLRPSDPLLWAIFLLLALAAIRNIALFAFVAAPILVHNAGAWLDAHERRSPALARLLPAAVATLLVLLTWDVARDRFFTRLEVPRETGLGIMTAFYPVRAVDWIERERPPKPLGHHMADGGYLIWTLYPDYPVLSDGRLEVYRSRPEVLGLRGEKSFRELDAKYRFGTVLLHYAQIDLHHLVGTLYRDPEWRLAFVDEVAAVFVRRLPGDRRPDLDTNAPDLFPPSPGTGYAGLVSRLGRARFYDALGQHGRARELLREARDLYPNHVKGG